MKPAAKQLPRARTEGLLVQQLPDETVVYDLDRHRAHCLNKTAAQVWKQCDGKTLVGDAVDLLEETVGDGRGEPALWYSIEQLHKAHLLAQPVVLPAPSEGLSRRTLLRRMGLTAALGLPLVTTMLAPTAVQAASCLPSGAPCSSSAQCCSGICTGGTCL